MSTDPPSVPQVLDITQWSDRKKFDAEVQHILLQFEKPKEWADLMNCLIKLHKSILQSPICEIPQKEIICKRLAQCLNPQLPSGIHVRALEVYSSILQKVGPEGLAQNLALFSSGLFPFFTYSSSSVRPIFLNIIEQFYIPLGKKLLPCLIGLLICILPGLDDNKSESYEHVYKVLEQISDCVSEKSYMRALWVILLNASKIRMSTLTVIANKLAPGLPMLPPERVEILVPHRHVLVMKSLEATTEDESLLVLREMINMLIKHFPMDSDILSDEDKSVLCRQCLKLLTKRNWSLNRRLYHWIFNATNDFNTSPESLDLTYFTKYTKDNLISAIKDLLMAKGKDLEEVLIPIKIIVTFITDADLKGVTDKLMPKLCIPILKYICKEHEEEEWRANIVESTRLIFDTSLTPTNVIFESIVDEYNACASSPLASCSSVWHDLLELSSVYLDEICTKLCLEDVLCGLFMLVNNALDHLHKLKIENDLAVIDHIIMYISTIFSRLEAIIRGEGNLMNFADTIKLDEDAGKKINMVVDYQSKCNTYICRYLGNLYTDSLTHFEQQAHELSVYEYKIIDALNKLAVRFVALDGYMSVVPVTKGFNKHQVYTDAIDGAKDIVNNNVLPVPSLDETTECESYRLRMLFISDPDSRTVSINDDAAGTKNDHEVESGFKLSKWMEALLKCTTSSNAQLFCRGIRTFIELLSLSNKRDMYHYVETNGEHVQCIIEKLWNSLDETYAASHSEIVLLLIQFNRTMPLSRVEAEKIIIKDLTSLSTDVKVTAMLRFGVLWRYGYIHAPEEELFPEALGCILDNVEEADPKLRYYSCAFLSESVAILPNLINPILRALVAFDKFDPASYSSYIVDILRRFRHLSYIVSREGPMLLDLMQRCQAPPQLIELVQGTDIYETMLSSIASSKNIESSDENLNKVSVTSQMRMKSGTSMDTKPSEFFVAFPVLKDPKGISYEDMCIYDYVDLIVVLTLKYICLDVDVSSLLNFTTFEGLLEYANGSMEQPINSNHAFHENTMLFRCTAIDFMKLFLSTIQPTSRAKEVACLVSRPLLFVLYHFHLKDEAIIQTQLLYLLKVVMDRCHVDSQSVSEMTLALIDAAKTLSKQPVQHKVIRNRINDVATPISKAQELDYDNMDGTDIEREDVAARFIMGTPETKNWQKYKELPGAFMLSPAEATSIRDYSARDILDVERRDTLDVKSCLLSRIYILNVIAIKRCHVGKLKKLSEEPFFSEILESCIRNTGKSSKPHLLQSYLDFSLYTLKYITGAESIRYSAAFISHFCNHLNQGKETTNISAISQYLKAMIVLLRHITSELANCRVDLKCTDRFNYEGDLPPCSLSSILSLAANGLANHETNDSARQLFGFGNKHKCTSATIKDPIKLEISQVVKLCIQCLLWVKTENNLDIVNRTRGLSHADTVITEPSQMSSIYFTGETNPSESIRLDIVMAIQNIYHEILYGFRFLFELLPYHFTEGCLILWDEAENTSATRELKLEMIRCLSAVPQFSRHKMITYIVDMLEPFAKSSKYKVVKGYQLLSANVRDNSVCEFIYALTDVQFTSKKDVESTWEVIKRYLSFVLSYPRQPMVLLWVFHIIINFDKTHPTTNANAIEKLMKKCLSELMYALIYQSVGMYMHKVCQWLAPGLYDLESPLPPHVYIINKYYHDRVNPKDSILNLSGYTTGLGAIKQNPEVNPIDRQECASINTLSQLVIFSHETVQLSRRTAVANVFFHVLCNSLGSYILPTLQQKTEQPLEHRYLVLLLLRHLPFKLYEGSLHCIKRSVIDFINASYFFKNDRRGLRCTAKIFRLVADDDCRGTVDRLNKLDQYTCPPHSSVFTSKTIDIQSRIKYLKRLAFVLYACRSDTFAMHIATIIERLTENFRAYDDDNLRAKTFLVMRVLLIKMSQKHLTVLWPVLLSELIKVFDRENRALSNHTSISNLNAMVRNDSTINVQHTSETKTTAIPNRYILLREALKIIDFAYALRLNDFLIYQWMFINDRTDAEFSGKQDEGEKDTFEFMPFLMIVEQKYPDEVKQYLRSDMDIKMRKLMDEMNVQDTAFGSTIELDNALTSIGTLMTKDNHGLNNTTNTQDSSDKRKLTQELIDISIENELLETNKDETDLEMELNIYQICKMYRKVI